MRRHLVIEQQPYSSTCFSFSSWKTDHLFRGAASRFSGRSLSWKNCKPGCGTKVPSVLHDDNISISPTLNSEMHSISFSLNSSLMSGLRQTLEDLIVGSEISDEFSLEQGSPNLAHRSWQKNVADASFESSESASNADHGGSESESFASDWVAQVDRGVYITFCTALDGFNDLKRINFSRPMFTNKQSAKNWWTENYQRIQVLYNVRPPSSTSTDEDSFDDTSFSSANDTSCSSSNELSDYSITRRKSSANSRLKEDFSSNDSDVSACHSWIEQDETGVFLTIITIPGVGRQLKRIRFSRGNFSEGEAAAWWENNRQRIHTQYISINTSLRRK